MKDGPPANLMSTDNNLEDMERGRNYDPLQCQAPRCDFYHSQGYSLLIFEYNGPQMLVMLQAEC